MSLDGCAHVEHALAGVVRLLDASLPDTLPQLSAVAGEVVPHEGVLLYSGDCIASPVRSHGDVPTGPATVVEMIRLANTVEIGQPWHGHITIADTTRSVLAVASSPDGSAGSVLAGLLPDGYTPSDAASRIFQHLWDIAAAHIVALNTRVEPAKLSHSRVVSNERARIAAELTDAHATTLTTLLGALRSHHLPDARARHTATDLAASALVELRTAREDERSHDTETLDEAFSQMADKLVLLMRYNDATLDLGTPDEPDHPLPASVANAARASVRGAVLTMLGQADVTRIRVAWNVVAGALHVSVRDNGPGTLTRDDFGIRRLAMNLAALDAELDLDAAPGWGSTITVKIPLSAPETPAADPLTKLNPREVDVLRQLTHGHRNRQIAQHLHISEHTVKYHVANILDKFGVSSRGEAAAAARDLGFVPSSRDAQS
ncbi:helix-turn-helix transcriptional regulator [Phytoactinopolyspora endophytica]|uniref:helix-turn-helix transcriptional regulator n=1 Tax=Phytoactinopolyspora endophytica TaxID=1642495 RepID=UPI0013E9CDC4|nr:LuxR C-terminal-related transcriptional regulator [Phytoactinopolyspora endophytica]